jgi:hypothetical protein
MTEVRRFLRYTIPGLVFLLSLFIGLCLTDVKVALGSLQKIEKINGVIAILFAVGVSGGMGYIFSVIYQLIREITPLRWNYNAALNILINKRMFVNSNGNTPIHDIDKIGKRERLVLFNTLYFSYIPYSKSLRNIERYIYVLTDIMHGIGASFFGILAALIFWIYFVFFIGLLGNHNVIYCIIGITFFIILLIAFAGNYYFLKRYIECQTNSALISCFQQKIDGNTEEVYPDKIILVKEKKSLCSYLARL